MTQDCPICLDKISSSWGVCSPCGHALHQNCWHQLVDSSRGRRCPVCNAAVGSFVKVFMDVDATERDDEICELKEAVRSKDLQLQKFEGDIAELVEKNNEKCFELLNTYAQLIDKDMKLRDLKESILAKNKELEQVHCELKMSNEKNRELEEAIRGKTAGMLQKYAQLIDKNVMLRDLKASILAKNKELEQVHCELKMSNEKNRELEEEIRGKATGMIEKPVTTILSCLSELNLALKYCWQKFPQWVANPCYPAIYSMEGMKRKKSLLVCVLILSIILYCLQSDCLLQKVRFVLNLFLRVGVSLLDFIIFMSAVLTIVLLDHLFPSCDQTSRRQSAYHRHRQATNGRRAAISWKKKLDKRGRACFE